MGSFGVLGSNPKTCNKGGGESDTFVLSTFHFNDKDSFKGSFFQGIDITKNQIAKKENKEP